MSILRNKRKSIIIGMIILVILVVSICLVKKSKRLNEEEIKSIIFNDWKTLTESEQTPEYLLKIDEMSDFEIVKMEYSEKIYDVTVNVKGVDVGGTLSKIEITEFPMTADENELNKFLVEIISKSPRIETEAKVQVEVISDNEYQVNYSEEFVDAMSGLVYTYSKNTIEDTINKSDK